LWDLVLPKKKKKKKKKEEEEEEEERKKQKPWEIGKVKKSPRTSIHILRDRK